MIKGLVTNDGIDKNGNDRIRKGNRQRRQKHAVVGKVQSVRCSLHFVNSLHFIMKDVVVHGGLTMIAFFIVCLTILSL